MGKFKLAFGLHNHQPIGNFEAVFEHAHQSAYQPFLELVKEYEGIHLSLHQSGILWDWQKRTHPEYFELLGKMIDRGQVELLTGGFYEPILTAIPQRDALGQICQLTEFLSEHFGVEPSGLWLTERIWEPHLPSLLAPAGVKFLPIDDTHFIYAGFEPERLDGPMITENEGECVTLLPIRKRLRYLIPFGTVDEVIAELRKEAERNPDGMIIYADDGEKFGVWPNTHAHCFEDGWLRRFFDALTANSDWLEVVSLGEAATVDPVGRAYLPSASYEEMLHWSLPTEAFREYEEFERWLADSGQSERFGRFVRGGHWRGFLTKYEEVNLMHKKMLRVSDELRSSEVSLTSEHRQLWERARDDLYASQCNCPYWHGVFGGLYLPHIRQAVYARMNEAHARLRQLGSRPAPTITVEDFDRDGKEEIVLDSDRYFALFKPDSGGALLELSLNQQGFTLTDTLSRRREGYHVKLDQAQTSVDENSHASIHDLVLAKEEGLGNLLREDHYLRRCLIDHLFVPEVALADFEAGHYVEAGDFVGGAYEYSLEGNLGVKFWRDGLLWHEGKPAHLRLEKQISLVSEGELLRVDYTLSSREHDDLGFVLAVENCFSFQAGHAEDRFILLDDETAPGRFLDSMGSHAESRRVTMVDNYRQLAVAVESDCPATIWNMPIFTVSLSEGGFEKVYQGTSLIHSFHLNLSALPFRLSLAIRAGDAQEILQKLRPASREV